MSAAPRYPAELGYAGLIMTADEYLALGETPERYELIHGVVWMAPSSGADHSELGFEIAAQIRDFARSGGGARVFTETDVRLSEDTVYRPDVCAFRASRLEGRVKRLTRPPDLIVEILSRDSKALDLITKRDDYERAGVGEYWVVDPDTLRFRVWRRQEGGGAEMIEVSVAPEAETLACEALPGFVLDMRALRALFGEG